MMRGRNSIIPKILIAIFVISITIIDTAWCKSLYVSTTGSDSVSYTNNSITTPWKTVKQAIYNARAGDVVYFRAGTYDITSQIDTANNGYDGSSAAPVVFTRYGTEVVTWRSTLAGTVIRVGKNYHHYEYLNFRHEPSGSMPGESGFLRSGYEESSNGFWVKYCTFTMTSRGDNYGSVHLKSSEPCTNVEITHNRITHTGTSGSTNSSGIICFGNNSFKINNNEIIGPPMGIYLKHANDTSSSSVNGEVRNNFVKSTTRRAFFCNFNYVLIENNIFHSDNSGSSDGNIQINEDNGGPGGDYNTIRNNTIMCGIQFQRDSGGATNNKFYGNIVAGSGKLWKIHPYATLTDYTISDYNLFISGTCISRNGVSYTLSSWKTSIKQDLHSLSGTPTFVGGSAPSTIAGYQLSSGSLGKGKGINGADIGADVTKVGISGSDSQSQVDITPPSSPTSVIIKAL